MVGGGGYGAMMMCLFLVMVRTEEDMVFLQRVSTIGSDHKMVENLRRKLMTDNFDYELKDARAPRDSAQDSTLHVVDKRTPEAAPYNDGKRSPEATLNDSKRSPKTTRPATLYNVKGQTPLAALGNVGNPTPDASLYNVGGRVPKVTLGNNSDRAQDVLGNDGDRAPVAAVFNIGPNNTGVYVENVSPDAKTFELNNALHKAMRISDRSVPPQLPAPHAPRQRGMPQRRFNHYRYAQRRMYGFGGVTFTARRFKFRQI